MITHSSYRTFVYHVLTLVFIFALTIANLIICSLKLTGAGRILAMLFDSIMLLVLFVYSMLIPPTYCDKKAEEDSNSSSRPFFKLTGFGSKGYDTIPPNYLEGENIDV